MTCSLIMVLRTSLKLTVKFGRGKMANIARTTIYIFILMSRELPLMKIFQFTLALNWRRLSCLTISIKAVSSSSDLIQMRKSKIVSFTFIRGYLKQITHKFQHKMQRLSSQIYPIYKPLWRS